MGDAAVEKTFRLGYDVKAYNAKLRAARERIGLDRKSMAALLGISHGHYCSIERMTLYPSERVMELIEVQTGELREDLFPEEIRRFAHHEGRVERDIPVVLLPLDSPEVLALPAETSVEEEVDSALLRDKIDELLDILPLREKRILQLRYGLEDGRERTYKEIGVLLGLGPERIRQLEARALRKLRYSPRAFLQVR